MVLVAGAANRVLGHAADSMSRAVDILSASRPGNFKWCALGSLSRQVSSPAQLNRMFPAPKQEACGNSYKLELRWQGELNECIALD